jgi:hypothetical protein
MKHRAILTIGLSAMALLACQDVTLAAGPPGIAVYTGASGPTKVRYQRKRPLEVTIYGRRRIGGYSYRASDVTSTNSRMPPPWANVRQSPGGPFDSGFFFDSGIEPRGGNSPYNR